MKILALDTTGVFGSVALVEDQHTIEEVPLHSTDGFAHLIFGAIESALARQAWQLSDIDLFAAASGPGSFTGVRVGLTAAKGLAEATGKKAAAVSNLKAIASFGDAALRAPLLDARRGQIFAALYGGDLEIIQPEIVIAFPDWQAQLPAGVQFIGQDLAPFALGDRPQVIAPRAIAAAVARLAAQQGGEDPAALDANYVRRSDAELMWHDRQSA